MQVPYHDCCLVDAGFGHIKRLYRRSDVDSLSSMINVVDKSAKSNVPVGYENPQNGEHNLECNDRKNYFSAHFCPLPGNRKYRHFTFDVQSPGLYIVQIVNYFSFIMYFCKIYMWENSFNTIRIYTNWNVKLTHSYKMYFT